MNENITNLWQEFTDWLKNNNPTEYEKLNKPASEKDFEAFKAATGYDFPSNLRELYSINNGANGINPYGPKNNFNMVLSHAMFPISEIIDHWKSFPRDIEVDSLLSSYPDKAIKIDNYNPKWIPIMDDAGGNYIGVDLDPDVNGTVGQVINFGRDEDNKFVVASSFEAFLQLLLSQIKAKNVEIVTEDDGVKHWNLKGSGHLTDGLRKLLVPQTGRVNSSAAPMTKLSFLQKIFGKRK